MHPRVAVHEFSTGTLSFAEELELWTDLGVTNVGLVPAKVDVVGRDAVAAALGDRSLRVSSMFGGTFFDLTDPDSWARSQTELKSTLEWSASVGAGCVYVVVSDFVIGSLVSPDRRVPGDGDLPLRTLVEQVLAAGYDGPFELEVFGPAIDDEGAGSAMARATDRLSELLDEVGA